MKIMKEILETLSKLILGMIFMFIVLILFAYFFNNPQTFFSSIMVGLSFLGFFYIGDWLWKEFSKHILKKEPNE